MSMYSDLLEYVRADATIGQAVSLVRLSYAEQEDDKPFIAIVPDTEERLAGHSTGSGNKVAVRLSINCHATTFEQAYDIKEAVRLRLDAYRGYMLTSFVSQCKLLNVTYDNPGPYQGQESGDHVALMNFSITADESASEVR